MSIGLIYLSDILTIHTIYDRIMIYLLHLSGLMYRFLESSLNEDDYPDHTRGAQIASRQLEIASNSLKTVDMGLK